MLIPTCGGRGGHPVLIPAVAASIVSWQPPDAKAATDPASGGLRAFWKAHPDLVERIEFPQTPEILRDLDAPGDYAAAKRHAE